MSTNRAGKPWACLSHADLSGTEIAYTAFHKALLDGLKHDGVLAAIKLRL